MAKKKTATKTTKKWRYSSFKAKIDDLHIEPARNLSKRAHDYVETSHFLASFDHWKEINLSAVFTDFVREIENIIQTLPQILYHQDKIFQNIVSGIKKYDTYSLQPLLDLLAQFCHDLGPDFIKFYKDAVTCLISLLDEAVKFENTNVFEWGFNCLAYIFKYLSRLLTADLKPTFELLFPLLTHSKEYLSRFSAEAMSFLIRKSTSKNLLNFVAFSLKNLDDKNDSSYYNGLVTLFTESLTTTQESLHSKSKLIISSIIQNALSKDSSEPCVSILCDVWLNIASFASAENMEQIYEEAETYLNDNVDSLNVNNAIKFITALVFAESGKKVNDWSQISNLVQKVCMDKFDSTIDAKYYSVLFAVLFRNCDMQNLTQIHKRIFDFYLQNIPTHSLEFFRFALDFAPEKFITFNGNKYVQKYVQDNLSTHPKKIALFFLELESNPGLSSKLNIVIPENYSTPIFDSLLKFAKITSLDEIYDIYCNLLLLTKFTSRKNDRLLSLLNSLLSSHLLENDFVKDVCGLNLMLLEHDDSISSAMLENLLRNIDILKSSKNVLKGLQSLLSTNKTDPSIIATLKQYPNLIVSLSDNLCFPDSSFRYETLNLIILLLQISEKEVPQILNDCRIIEQIPLSLQNARDITVRIRNMGTNFVNSKSNKYVTNVFFKHMFGLLTIRFSPVWEGIYEILPKIYSKNSDLMWKLIYRLTVVPDDNFSLDYYDKFMDCDSNSDIFEISAQHFNTVINDFMKVWTPFNYEDSSIIKLSEEARGTLKFPPQIRSQALKIMLLIPQLTEHNSKDIVPFLFDDLEYKKIFRISDDKLDAKFTSATWVDADRDALLKVISKFKNIKSIFKSKEVYSRLLVLLGSRTTDIQLLALDGLLAYKDPIMVKYRDNLRNLLDDNLFKDEITVFMANDESRIIEDADEAVLMPIVLRILFGRAQTSNAGGSKKGRKIAVISILPTLKKEHIIEFLKLGSSGFDYAYFFNNEYVIDPSEVSISSLRRMTGFVTVLNLTLTVLGTNFPEVLETTLHPLLYSIGASYYSRSATEMEGHVDKIISNLRQQSLKALNSIFQNVGDKIDWKKYIDDIENVVLIPRLENFETENLQSPSSIMNMITYWASNKLFYSFLYYKNYSIINELMKILCNPKAKESVIHVILVAANKIVKNSASEDEYVELIGIIASVCLKVLPELFERLESSETLAVATDLLLSMTESGYIQDDETRSYLIKSLTLIIQEKIKSVSMPDITKMLKVLSTLVREYNCPWKDIEPLYKSISSLYRIYPQKDIRIAIGSIFTGLCSNFPEMKKVADLLVDLNSYSNKRMEEYDFQKRLLAFKTFLDDTCMSFTDIEWLPVLYNALFFIKDKNELVIRTNATHVLKKYIDFINSHDSMEAAENSVSVLKTVILPVIRTSLKTNIEELLTEYISVMAYIVENSKFYDELSDMKILLYNGDEEANFFININHIQLHRRQRAIRRLKESASKLSDNSVAHYLFPIVENFVFKEGEKYESVSNEALVTIGVLSNSLSWNQYKAIIRRYIGLLKSKPEQLRVVVLLVTRISVSLKNTLQSLRDVDTSLPVLKKFPTKLSEPDSFVKNEIYPTLVKILDVMDPDTIIFRTPLAEALVNLTLGLTKEDTISLLPGILTSICQVLRSKSNDLREAIRKTLTKITVILGSEYLPFIIKELLSALQRGSQVHVLSFTVHHILKALEDTIQHADLDDSASLIVRVIMEDIFGATGEEKDAENYHSKMLEVKVNRSYDTGEMLASNISLPIFSTLIRPIKLLLQERMKLKSQNKLAELLRRYALGLNHNSDCSSSDVLTMCYEIYKDSNVKKTQNRKPKESKNETEEFFLVDLNFKNTRVENETSLQSFVLKKFALDLLRTVIVRHRVLMTTENMEGFIPFLNESLKSENEGIMISTLRLLIILVKLDFSSESEPIFKNCAITVLNIIKDSPSTSSELCQMGLKFFSAFIRYKDIELKDSALSFILKRILPYLNEPQRQGLAFGFLKAVISKHIKLPEIYDVVDTVREIMITNHSKEIRDVSRSVYYQFLMEYDQSRGRLDKQFKFMVDNLQYPAPDGRQSVMELINLIVTKANVALLAKLSSSFFVALASVSFNDDVPKCREMASILLQHLLGKLDDSNKQTIEKYISAWLRNSGDVSFLNLGLRIYKIYLVAVGFDGKVSLNDVALSKIKGVLSNTGVGSDSEWDLIYTSLNAFQQLIECNVSIYQESFKSIWRNCINCLLYPHSWVRQLAANIINIAINSQDKFEEKFTDVEIQKIASRVLRQISAPNIPENLSSISIKTLVKIAMVWKDNNAPYIIENKEESNKGQSYENAIDFMISRTSSIIRSEENPQDFYLSKKTGLQFFALLIQIIDEHDMKTYVEKIILALYNYTETDNKEHLTDEQEELRNLATECMQLLEKKLNVSDFTMAYANVKQIVIDRRKERRAKRAILAVNAPDVASRIKLKKHFRSKEKRKHEKDENGYYQRKNKKKRV
ncbi:hypothetical protein TBLA_0F00330 [Henningerozyma blattae CBS 6284]|uniref:Uncharacterized protein n=1 Tax=Henningerozyma blattae (strain ATCC 34711 / CBS 6284 / DSM 70876 / NBRC 10599 / NRRL Y-10934 / UCD 77-7) TaxID=1071380 RepID=I2H5C5_HENB6|nr:hypothetical protein TBLA_0F00330 [Tetrapisispora blattae CBS 6284]CCH61577.1 hypothetical protein TBLA_0F00330 [Tetrapisispora blattae CBS 6284]